MEKQSQQIPGGGGSIVRWVEADKFVGILQFSNSMNTRQAIANGVQSNGTLSIAKKYQSKVKFDSYIKDPKNGYYARIMDGGIIESGQGHFDTIQFAVQQTASLPK